MHASQVIQSRIVALSVSLQYNIFVGSIQTQDKLRYTHCRIPLFTFCLAYVLEISIEAIISELFPYKDLHFKIILGNELKLNRIY